MSDYIKRDVLLEARELAICAYENAGVFNADAIRNHLKPLLDAVADTPAADVAEVCFLTELHVGDRAWKKAMSILDKKYAEAKKLPFIRDPLAWALYHTWKEFDDGKHCD